MGQEDLGFDEWSLKIKPSGVNNDCLDLEMALKANDVDAWHSKMEVDGKHSKCALGLLKENSNDSWVTDMIWIMTFFFFRFGLSNDVNFLGIYRN